MRAIGKGLSGSSRHALGFAIRINAFGIGLAALWTTLNTIILPERVSDLVSDGRQGTGLGVISLIGIGAAALVEPVAGFVSDRSRRSDRRRPYIVGGTAVVLFGIVAFGLAAQFAVLLVAYVVMQVASNVAQAAFQALIPDLVPKEAQGLASGVKSALNVIGIGVGLVGTQLIVAATDSDGLALTFLAAVLAVSAVLVLRWVPPVPPDRSAQSGDETSVTSMMRSLLSSSVSAFRSSPTFARAVTAQFLFLLGAYSLQRFLLYFLDERFGLDTITLDAGGFIAAGIVLGILAALIGGHVSDRIGRVAVLRVGIVIGSVGLAAISLAPSLLFLAAAGVLVAIGAGTFLSVNWALISQGIPAGKGAQYYALANIATAGAGAMAGLFGPLADLIGVFLPGDAYAIAFFVAAIISFASLIPLRHEREGRDEDSRRV